MSGNEHQKLTFRNDPMPDFGQFFGVLNEA
jgi:hypothetical protein